MHAELSSRKRSAIAARETAKLFLLTRPVARPLLQEADERIAAGEAVVERMDHFQGCAVIRRWTGRSVVWRGPDSLPNLTQLGGRKFSEFLNQTFGGRGHGLTLLLAKPRAKRILRRDWHRCPRTISRFDTCRTDPHPIPLPSDGRGRTAAGTRPQSAFSTHDWLPRSLSPRRGEGQGEGIVLHLTTIPTLSPS